MTPLLIAVIVSMSTLPADPAAPTAAPAFPDPDQKSLAEDPNSLVCTYVAPRGSRIPKRQCMTKAQARQLQEDSQRYARDSGRAQREADMGGRRR